MKHVRLFEGFVNEAKGQSIEKLTDDTIKQIMGDKNIRGNSMGTFRFSRELV